MAGWRLQSSLPWLATRFNTPTDTSLRRLASAQIFLNVTTKQSIFTVPANQLCRCGLLIPRVKATPNVVYRSSEVLLSGGFNEGADDVFVSNGSMGAETGIHGFAGDVFGVVVALNTTGATRVIVDLYGQLIATDQNYDR